MTYTSVKKFTLSEEDKEAIARTHNIIRQIGEKVYDDEWFESNIHAINKKDMDDADDFLDTFLGIITYNNNDIIIKQE